MKRERRLRRATKGQEGMEDVRGRERWRDQRTVGPGAAGGVNRKRGGVVRLRSQGCPYG